MRKRDHPVQNLAQKNPTVFIRTEVWDEIEKAMGSYEAVINAVRTWNATESSSHAIVKGRPLSSTELDDFIDETRALTNRALFGAMHTKGWLSL